MTAPAGPELDPACKQGVQGSALTSRKNKFIAALSGSVVTYLSGLEGLPVQRTWLAAHTRHLTVF